VTLLTTIAGLTGLAREAKALLAGHAQQAEAVATKAAARCAGGAPVGGRGCC
jgi:hypothetical protein